MKRTRSAKKKPPAELSLDYLPLGELEKWPRNPKKHDIEGLKAAIRRWGFTLPIMLDETTHRMVAGHGRQESLSQMKAAGEQPPQKIRMRDDGEWLVPVIRGNDFGSEEEAEKYLIADNRFVEIGGWDPVMLSDMLAGFDGDELASVGFDESEVARLNAAAEPEQPPEKFVSFTAKTVPTQHECPRCHYKFSE